MYLYKMQKKNNNANNFTIYICIYIFVNKNISILPHLNSYLKILNMLNCVTPISICGQMSKDETMTKPKSLKINIWDNNTL